MSCVDALRTLLDEQSLEPIRDGCVVLKGPKQEVTLLVGTTNVVAVKMDKFGHPLPGGGFKKSGGWKQCDYALIWETGDRTDAVLIELKKTRANDVSSGDQLRQSVPLLRYLAAAAHLVASPDDDPAADPAMLLHYAVLYERHGRALDKQPTHPAGVARAGRERGHGMDIRWRVGAKAALEDLLCDP